jgi:hypothetical protein
MRSHCVALSSHCVPHVLAAEDEDFVPAVAASAACLIAQACRPRPGLRARRAGAQHAAIAEHTSASAQLAADHRRCARRPTWHSRRHRAIFDLIFIKAG